MYNSTRSWRFIAEECVRTCKKMLICIRWCSSCYQVLCSTLSGLFHSTYMLLCKQAYYNISSTIPLRWSTYIPAASGTIMCEQTYCASFHSTLPNLETETRQGQLDNVHSREFQGNRNVILQRWNEATTAQSQPNAEWVHKCVQKKRQ